MPTTSKELDYTFAMPQHRARGGIHDARIRSRVNAGKVLKKDGREFLKIQIPVQSERASFHSQQKKKKKKKTAQYSHKYYSTADIEDKADRIENGDAGL